MFIISAYSFQFVKVNNSYEPDWTASITYEVDVTYDSKFSFIRFLIYLMNILNHFFIIYCVDICNCFLLMFVTYSMCIMMNWKSSRGTRNNLICNFVITTNKNR